MKLSWIEAGEVVTTHGIKGEVKVLPWLDTPEDLCAFSRCRIGGQMYAIAQCRIQKGCNLVKLVGVDDLDAARALKGMTVECDRAEADANTIYAAELMGMEVFCEGACIGTITDVLYYPRHSVYVVQGAHSYMIPAVHAFILATDLDSNRMDVQLIEGMQTDEN